MSYVYNPCRLRGLRMAKRHTVHAIAPTRTRTTFPRRANMLSAVQTQQRHPSVQCKILDASHLVISMAKSDDFTHCNLEHRIVDYPLTPNRSISNSIGPLTTAYTHG